MKGAVHLQLFFFSFAIFDHDLKTCGQEICEKAMTWVVWFAKSPCGDGFNAKFQKAFIQNVTDWIFGRSHYTKWYTDLSTMSQYACVYVRYEGVLQISQHAKATMQVPFVHQEEPHSLSNLGRASASGLNRLKTSKHTNGDIASVSELVSGPQCQVLQKLLVPIGSKAGIIGSQETKSRFYSRIVYTLRLTQHVFEAT